MTEPRVLFEGEPARRARRQVAALIAVAFLAGAGAGHVGTMLWTRAHRPPRGPGPGPGEPGGPGGHDRMLDHLARELQLDGATERRVREIFESHRPDFERVVDGLRPAMEKVRADTHAEVREALPPEKREAFDRFIAEQGPPEGGPRRPGDGGPRPGGGPPGGWPPRRPGGPDGDGSPQPPPPPPPERD